MPTSRLTIEAGPGRQLRLLTMDDVDELHRLTQKNLGYLGKWLRRIDSQKSRSDTRDFIRARLRDYEDGAGVFMGVLHRGDLAGIASLGKIREADRSGEIGYWLDEDHQGRGIMTAGVAALTSHALGEMGLNRVEIRVATGNVRSIAVPQRLGFVREGVLRQAEWLHDHFEDLAVYSMLADDWPDVRSIIPEP